MTVAGAGQRDQRAVALAAITGCLPGYLTRASFHLTYLKATLVENSATTTGHQGVGEEPLRDELIKVVKDCLTAFIQSCVAGVRLTDTQAVDGQQRQHGMVS
jgi:hypothetical protein